MGKGKVDNQVVVGNSNDRQAEVGGALELRVGGTCLNFENLESIKKYNTCYKNKNLVKRKYFMN